MNSQQSKIVLISGIIIAAVVGLGVGLTVGGFDNADKETITIQSKSSELKKITIAVMPNEDPKKFEMQGKALEEYFTKKLGIETEFFYPIDATTTVESLVTGSTQIAFMSARPAQLAHERSDGNALLFMAEVRPFTSEGGEKLDTFYHSEFWVRKDSGINTLEDAKGKNVAFSGPTSTSGYLFPLAKLVDKSLIKAGDDPKTYFSNVLFSGGYQQSLNALIAGQVDIAAGGDHAKFRYLTPEEQNQIKVIEKQGPVPTHGIIYRTDLITPSLLANFEKAVLDMKSERPDLLESALFGATDFVPVNHYAHLAELGNAIAKTKIPHI
ncbi:MAG: phosphate/phosphite/phosphonate ABC transporter substrate-binding protein [Crenarchaeota archaeon]|nr:MAG: phosphate/phosphite/phosphonate ABC transporter substrate-binding protein [Thermoproteota archaeon]RDJ33975.1 MAG: phosphate/phosphite/phosphonate ABC transporter substrate-binding protein [Thermoproteota archaeon]RDJ36910.1 MAG: phosphate/phosphite/phosphonate ABC transporter substrate-binding protein [Thermoproteota archaeon]RDJ37555.1 MAG: phosphate/phosphite/phosphonate ABC transporter substrate-binding protein [Thermoproteota archaeon]